MTRAPVARERCSVLANAAGDPQEGTAPPGDRWFLAEHLGPWSPHAVPEADVAPQVVRAVNLWARDNNGRVQVIRRTGRATRRVPPGALVPGRLPPRARVDPHRRLRHPGGPGLRARRTRRAPSPAAEPGVRPRPARRLLRDPRPAAGRRAERRGPGPDLGMLTPGRMPVLAVAGVAAARLHLRRRAPGGSGGAGGALRLPACSIPAGCAGGWVFPPVVQAAQHHARELTGALGVDALPPVVTTALDGGRTRVVFTDPDCAVTLAGATGRRRTPADLRRQQGRLDAGVRPGRGPTRVSSRAGHRGPAGAGRTALSSHLLVTTVPFTPR